MFKTIVDAYKRRAMRARRRQLSAELIALYSARSYINEREEQIVREAKTLDAQELQHSLATRRARAW